MVLFAISTWPFLTFYACNKRKKNWMREWQTFCLMVLSFIVRIPLQKRSYEEFFMRIKTKFFFLLNSHTAQR